MGLPCGRRVGGENKDIGAIQTGASEQLEHPSQHGIVARVPEPVIARDDEPQRRRRLALLRTRCSARSQTNRRRITPWRPNRRRGSCAKRKKPSRPMRWSSRGARRSRPERTSKLPPTPIEKGTPAGRACSMMKRSFCGLGSPTNSSCAPLALTASAIDRDASAGK